MVELPRRGSRCFQRPVQSAWEVSTYLPIPRRRPPRSVGRPRLQRRPATKNRATDCGPRLRGQRQQRATAPAGCGHACPSAARGSFPRSAGPCPEFPTSGDPTPAARYASLTLPSSPENRSFASSVPALAPIRHPLTSHRACQIVDRCGPNSGGDQVDKGRRCNNHSVVY